MTLFDCVTQYLEYLEAVGRSPRTIESYRQRLGSFIAHHGPQPVASLTARDVDQWLLAMRRQATVYDGHPYHPAQARPLSPHTIHTRARSLVMLLAWSVERGHMERSPAAHVRLNKPRCKRIKAVAKPDMKELVRAAKMRAGDGQCRDLAIFGFMLDTGVRSGELVSVELADLDLPNLAAFVDGKVGRRRVFFSPETGERIGQWLTTHPGGRWLFCGLHQRLGEQMTVDSVYQMFKRRAADRGVNGRHNPHGVRHLVGQSAAEQVGLRDTQLLLGHIDINSTMVYAAADENRLREVVSRVNALE